MEKKKQNTMQISLRTVSEVTQFVELNAEQDFEIDASSGRYVIDAKSIMGVFGMDLSRPITIQLHTDNGLKVARYEQKLKEIITPVNIHKAAIGF